jgi:aspartate 1-decarboxylase
MRQFLRSKIHRAAITQTDLHYEGSLSLDRDLMDAARIGDHEVIHVVNVNNGERFTTYAIEGDRGSGIVGLNGAAARLGMPGDLVIIMTFEFVHVEDGGSTPVPIVVGVDEKNRVVPGR